MTTYCINAWASVFDTILLYLSGGLDSSVVLACLSECRNPSTVFCANRYGPHVAEDERYFARLVSSNFGIKLLEIPNFSDSQSIEDSLTHIPITAKPTISSVITTLQLPTLNTLARELNADSIWTGQGGDHLFVQSRFPVGPIDYVALRGFGPGLLTALRDATHISKRNYWSIAKLLLRNNRNVPEISRRVIPIHNHAFVTPDARSRVSDEMVLHPWLVDMKAIPPGQQLQIAALADVLNRHRPLPGVEVIYEHHPFLSQPLIELCLRIPSYVHLRGGTDRAVERAAFSGTLPSEIISRTQKGESTFSLLSMLERSKDYVRELLSDGILVKEGILDRLAVDPFLQGKRPTDATTLPSLLASIAAELWVQNWRNSLRSVSKREIGSC